VDLNYRMGKKFQQRYETEKAQDHFKKIMELDPDDQQGYMEECTFRIAMWETQANKDPEPIKAFIASYPDSEKFLKNAYSNLASTYRRVQDKENTAATYEVILQKFPEDARLMSSYASAIFNMKMEDLYEKGLELNKKSVELDQEMERSAFYNLVSYYRNTDNTEKMLEEYGKAMEKWPDNTSLKNGYGSAVATMKLGDRYDSAIDLLEKTFAENPKSSFLLFTLHNLYKAKGDMDKALDYMKKVVEANPNAAYYKEALEKFEKELEEKKD
jgi:tetratricopeptide (TPR) repeat protein